MDDAEGAVNVIGIEVLVSRLNDAVDYLSGVLGFPVVWRGPAHDASGDMAVLDGGPIAITLFEPTADTDDLRSIVPDRTPRLSQIVVGASDDVVAAAIDRTTDAGVSVQRIDAERSFVPPAVFEGVLGFPTTLMFTSLPEEPTDAVDDRGD